MRINALVTTLLFVSSIILSNTNGFGQLSLAESDSSTWMIELTDVVVTAQYAPTDLRAAVHAVRVIPKELIAQRASTNLEQLLQQDIGVRISQDMVLGSSLSLQGIDGEGVKIMVDGVPVTGRLDGKLDLTQINLAVIERVEIIEGPMSVSYGTDALGGVVNLITRKSQLKKVELKGSYQYEKVGERVAQLGAGIHLSSNLLLQLNVGYDEMPGLSFDSIPGRDVLWNPRYQKYTDALLCYRWGSDQVVRYQYSYLHEIIKDLGDVRLPSRPTLSYAFDDEYVTVRNVHSLSHEGSLNKHWYLQSVAAWSGFDRERTRYKTLLSDDSRTALTGFEDTTRFSTLTFRSAVGSKKQNTILNYQAGVDVLWESTVGNKIFDPNAIEIGKANFYEAALFGSLKWNAFTTLQIEGGLRATYNSNYKAPLVPSLHALWKIAEYHQVRASYGHGFRSPRLKELFLEFVDVNHYILGNQSLVAERSDNIQVTYQYQPKALKNGVRLSGRINLFYNDVRDKISLYQIQVPEGVNTIGFQYFNQETFRTVGANLRGSLEWRNFRLAAGIMEIGYYNPVSELHSEVPSYTWNTEWNTELNIEIPNWAAGVSFFARVNDKLINFYPGTLNGKSTAFQRVQEGYAMLDLTLRKSFLKNKITLLAGCKNMLDVTLVRGEDSGVNYGPHGSGGLIPVATGVNPFLGVKFQLGW